MFKVLLQVYKKVGILVFVFLLLGALVDQFLNNNIEVALHDPVGLENSIWVYGFISLISGILFPLFTLMLVLYARDENSKNIFHFFKNHIQQLVIESMRAWGKILFWSLFFILPGIFLYFAYTFVPFVVVGSAEYANNKIDALKESKRLFKKSWLKILSVIIVLYFLIPLIMTQLFDSYRVFTVTPLSATLLVLTDSILFIFSVNVIYQIYLKVRDIEIAAN